jgi:hypothetical protein
MEARPIARNLLRAGCGSDMVLHHYTTQGQAMSSRGLIEYSDAGQEVRAVFDDIKRTRKIEDVNNF